MVARFLVFILITLTLTRCTDTETFIPNQAPITYKGSAFIEVKDIDGAPLDGVKITFGSIIGYTDKEGLLYLKDVEMSASSYLTAELEGYFHGSRRLYPSKNQAHFVKLTLLPLQLAGNIESNAGGTIHVSDALSLNFPSDAIMDANGKAFEGTVSVFAQPINGDDPDLSTKMPGDLVGFNASGKLGAMGSFGMMAVELRSSAGDLLQVKTGSHVAMQMEVPSSMISSAPSTIPMWYFNEALGYWKEEGEATLTEGSYVAQLGHFSYWNCDVYFDLVKWGATFVYEDGSPASQITVCLTVLSLDVTRCDYTNNEGKVCGMVAANEVMLMEVKSPCGDVIYSQQIGPYSDTTMIGPITIPNSSVSITAVSGFAVDCNGDPVTNGFVKVKVGTQTYYTVLDEATGAFAVSVMNCDESDVMVTVVDEGAFKQSLPYAFSYAPVIDAGTITVCETITEFIDLEVVGFPDHYIYFFPNASIQGGVTTLTAQDSSNQSKFFYVSFTGIIPGVYTPNGAEVGVTLPNGDRAFASAADITVTITYFGDPGDYILGTLSGTWHSGPQGQGGPDYTLVGTFSVLRQ